MSWINQGGLSAWENPSQLIVQWDQVIYKNHSAPTVKSQLKRVEEMRKTDSLPKVQTIHPGASPEAWLAIALQNQAALLRHKPSETQKSISQSWDDIHRLSLAYYNDASLQEMLANWNRDDGVTERFSSVLSINNSLNEKLCKLIWDANPALKERYDDFRLVAEIPHVVGNRTGKWINVENYWANNDKFRFNVYHLDINGDWIEDTYELSLGGKAMYKNSLTQNNYRTIMDSAKHGERGFLNGKNPEDFSKLYTTTPSDIYDPLHPEKGVQWAVKWKVDSLLTRLQKPDGKI